MPCSSRKTDKTYKIIYADDHTLVRHTISDFINQFENFRVVAQLGDGKQLIDWLSTSEFNPDIVLLDIRIPVIDGYEAARWISKNIPEVHIIMLSIFGSKHAISLAKSVGASYFLTKDIEPKLMESIFLKIIDGESIYTERSHVKLSHKEINFLNLFCTNLTFKQIALKMNVSIRTVERISENLCKKFDVNNRTSLIIFALENGLTSTLINL